MPSHPPGMTPAVAAPVVLDAWGGPDHGPVLLLLHGFSDSGPCWADAIERWRQTFSVVTWDARGHGRSPRFTADQLAVGPGALMVADAVTAAEQLAARSGAAIGVVGHSMGGSTAAGLALARPDLVAALVLEDPALPGLPGGPGENQAEWGAEQVRGLQQIAAHGDRHQPQRHRVREVAAVDAGGERDREARAEDRAERLHQVHRQHVQRRAGEVHLLLAGREEAAAVLDDERVGELDAERQPQGARLVAQARHEALHLRPARVALEGAVWDVDVAIPELDV